ncbi:thiamine pyrophosphate-binding protein [Haloarchaeobius iranensis]|uniref:Acetolactate synthase-1/2/3 large subunit n=1 Tax=Haloarchaeobius iranensis TaxID=996166 RepID=A0A1G9U3L3_9EURY|nr:thiamine pyrophosphate-binding protein [Haloarchaeobius iranensis]SDM54423.1 acetolactate synthase-1/2/3 large subunit [Haloarchaeobius iranensis]
MNTAERVVETLSALGTEYVFGYPGGRVIEVFETLADHDEIQVVRPRDEREASVMAESYGRMTGQPGVLAGQGPWVGSLGNMGQMEARLASSPMVAITEASERGDYSTLAPYQQSRGDYGGLALPKILDGVTKEWWFPRSPTETVRSTQLAFKHATAGRPGPTAVILDGDAVSEEFPEDAIPPVWDDERQVENWQAQPTDDDVADAVEALEAAERPVVIAGNGVHAADAYDELQAVADAYDAVVATSYLGKSTIPETHERASGVIGSFGHEGANQVVSEADTLLVVGCRMNPMDTNWQAASFIRPDEQTIVHADIDTRNAGWVYPADVGLIGDAAESLAALADAGGSETGWALDRAAEAREDFSVPECESDDTPIMPQRACKAIESVVDSDTVVTADSGNNRFWLLNYLQTPDTETYYGSGGVGGMGWAAPAAVTAALLGKDAIGVAGDGGFTMTMTAVETAVDHGVAPTFVVLNDTSLGMVRQMDDSIPGVEFHDTDFVQAAEALGGEGHRITDPDDLEPRLEAARANDVPTVLDVRIDRGPDMAETLQSSFYAEVGGLHE